MHERHSPALLHQPADLAGQPVVRVNEVEVPRFVHRLDPQHTGRERAELRGEISLVQALERTGGDVTHAHARRELDDRREVTRGCPGEDLHIDAGGGETFGYFADVDIEAAGVTGARLV